MSGGRSAAVPAGLCAADTEDQAPAAYSREEISYPPFLGRVQPGVSRGESKRRGVGIHG